MRWLYPREGGHEYTFTDSRVVRRVLADVGRSRVAVSERQVTTDAVAVAAPIEVRGAVVPRHPLSSPAARRPRFAA